jgi:hypothetical protein
MATETAVVPAPVVADPPAAPAPAATNMYDAIDWKNPVPGVIKVATHLETLTMLSPAERMMMLQGCLLHVIGESSLSDGEKDAARVFVKTMLPHVVETAVAALEVSTKISDMEKKAETLLLKQPRITVKSIETVISDAASKRKWWCC